MKKLIKDTLYHPLFSGSLIMILGSNLTNALNYLYHLIMGRLLGPAGYGELAALLSLVGLIGVIPSFLGPVIIKFVSSSKNKEEIIELVGWLNNKVAFLGFATTIIVVLLSPLISDFLKIPDLKLLILLAVTFLFSLRSMFNRAILQGLLKFNYMVLTVLIENASKLIFGALLVYLGYSILGGMVGLVFSAGVGWYFSRFYIKEYISHGVRTFSNWNNLRKYSFFILIQSISTTSLYSTDVILVKHFFSSYDAGIYAALSTLSKIIFFAAGPVSSVMFPLVSKRQTEGNSHKKVFIYSLVLTIIISGFTLLVYNFFPIIVIKLLYGTNYLSASGLLAYFGLAILLFTLSSLFMSYYLSLEKTNVTFLALLAALGQLVGIYLFHNNLGQVISVSVAINSFLLVSLFVIFLNLDKEVINKNE